MCAEFARISAHLLGLWRVCDGHGRGHGFFCWTFTEREKIYNLGRIRFQRRFAGSRPEVRTRASKKRRDARSCRRAVDVTKSASSLRRRSSSTVATRPKWTLPHAQSHLGGSHPGSFGGHFEGGRDQLRLERARICAAAGSNTICARTSRIFATKRFGFRHPDRFNRRLLRPLSRPHGRDAPEAVPNSSISASNKIPRRRWLTINLRSRLMSTTVESRFASLAGRHGGIQAWRN